MTRAEIHSHREKSERFGPQVDDLYEQDLQACAEQGHAQSVEVCSRCGEVIGTMEDDLP